MGEIMVIVRAVEIMAMVIIRRVVFFMRVYIYYYAFGVVYSIFFLLIYSKLRYGEENSVCFYEVFCLVVEIGFM